MPVKFRRTMYVNEDGGVVSGGLTVEGDAIKKLKTRQIDRKVNREIRDLKKEIMKEVKRVKRNGTT